MEGNILLRYPSKEKKIFRLNAGEDSFYLCPFQDAEPTIFRGTIEEYKVSEIPKFYNEEIPFCSSKEEYLFHFDNYLSAFKEHNISKAILSRVKSKDIGNIDITSLFEKMCELYPTAFCYIFSIEGIGTWAGASPELLISYKENIIHTVALAGTKYSADEEVWTEKERVEHGLVEEYIKALASETNPLIKETKPHIVQAGKLYHLKSTFEFQAVKEDLPSFLSRIHPTPAICGLPFQKSKKLIEKTEKHNRKYYCGYIGVVPKDSTSFEMYVNIRCMQIIKSIAYLYIGGGITKDSQGEMEWIESERKSETMGKIWG